MRLLITGITGFVGSHLSEFLRAKGYEVFGTTHSGKLLSSKKVKNFNCDMRDSLRIREILSDTKPQQIYHLSAVSFPPDSIENPRMTYDVNFYGTINLLEAVKEAGLKSEILFVGSSDEYGVIFKRYMPITEDCLLNPVTPYAASKASADIVCYSYARTYNMNIVRVRPFNHTGPGQRAEFVCSGFAKQIVEIEAKIREPVIYTGNREIQRDFTDVRDIVSAYYLALKKGASDEVYNICSGNTYSIQWILNTLLKSAGLSVEIREDKSKLRHGDVKVIKGDCSKFRAITGWKSTIPFEKTLSDLLDYWREKVSNRHSSFVT
ncbi:MAG: GDP-mannose 4,6-dehydratase, partial [Nitrospinota bacterium]